jgi:hypothetical protein
MWLLISSLTQGWMDLLGSLALAALWLAFSTSLVRD